MSNIGDIVLIHNPIAGWRRRGRLRGVVNRLRALGRRVDVLETTQRGDAETFAALAERYRTIAVAGGDGTVNEVLNGLPRNAPPLAFVPLGTANVLACELGMRLGARAIGDLVHEGVAVDVFGGRANGRRFVLMVSAGIDAWTVRTVRTGLKRKIGGLAYVVALFRLMRDFPYPTYTVTVDGAPYLASTVIVTRARRYGGPFVIAPGASLRAPALTVVMATGKGLWNMLRYGAAIARGTLHELEDVITVEGRAVRIEGPDGDPVQADGDLVTALPVDIAADDAAYRLIVPEPYRDPAAA
jgi:diacylglycerol kinase (ATP)